jgi:hypothetical protein
VNCEREDSIVALSSRLQVLKGRKGDWGKRSKCRVVGAVKSIASLSAISPPTKFDKQKKFHEHSRFLHFYF